MPIYIDGNEDNMIFELDTCGIVVRSVAGARRLIASTVSWSVRISVRNLRCDHMSRNFRWVLQWRSLCARGQWTPSRTRIRIIRILCLSVSHEN